ncbi:MAG: hypothetical protein ACRD19_06350 [Terriglobia bacterium]
MDRDQRTDDAAAVAVEVFDLFRIVGDETIFDVSRAVDLIRAYGDRRIRDSWRRPRQGKVVALRIVSR